MGWAGREGNLEPHTCDLSFEAIVLWHLLIYFYLFFYFFIFVYLFIFFITVRSQRAERT